MNLIAAVGSCFLFFLACSADAAVPIACNPAAISPAERPRYNELVKLLRAALTKRHELPDGYRFHLDESTITLKDTAEWIAMERLCCPFFTFQLDVGAKGDTSLTIRAPAAAKPIIEAEFPAP